jgi:hypothetical protein
VRINFSILLDVAFKSISIVDWRWISNRFVDIGSALKFGPYVQFSIRVIRPQSSHGGPGGLLVVRILWYLLGKIFLSPLGVFANGYF